MSMADKIPYKLPELKVSVSGDVVEEVGLDSSMSKKDKQNYIKK